MNFKIDDDTFIKQSLDDKDREQSITRLSGRRKVDYWGMMFSMIIIGLLGIASLLEYKIEFPSFLFCFVMYLWIRDDYQETDSEIKMLKLAGALQQKQNDSSTSSGA